MDPETPAPADPDRDDRFAALLKSVQGDAAPPDRDFLARLRDQSAAAFAAPASPAPARSKGPLMYSRILGALAVTAAAIALFVFLLPKDQPKGGGGDAKPALAKVFADTADAKTVRIKVTAGGQSREIVAEKAGRWREERANGSYVIGDGEMTWLVDNAGKATRDDTKPPRDLLGLVLAGRKYDRPDLTKLAPKGTEKRGDDEFVVYQISVESPDGGINVEALVDPKTQKLRSMSAQAAGKLLAELQITAIGEDLPEDKFLVLNSLSEDGRVGKVADTQGVVSVKPLAQSRWTPIAEHFVLMPGDWLRTDSRGANAAAVKLISRTGLVVGPGSLVELTKPTQLKLSEGEVEISVPNNSAIELVGPEDQRVTVKGKQHYYLDRNQKLRLAGKEPLWLKGFKGATANESIGSLVAKVDGRSEPLSVGYHKVTVDIRDQIARTTIEESFVNHTNATLEGVFHFPLPQDASISEFGMWIGNELVMADVVEKQRAREIYEQIMREKRDPGLLEWAGGNIFKARVWPIFAGSEKRIKISYTQVLPLKGNKYTYSYALQSEMLQQHPLRELSLTVNVASAVPLKKVWSPTHTTRDQATANSARVEFTAQEYTPRKDFEVVVEQDKRPSDVVIVPHRRGADGYFLLQVMPPAITAERAVLPDGGPVRLLILADTSASMDRRQRQTQEAFIASLVSALTPQDTFNLACCDVTCDWAFEKPVPADGKNLIAARDMLQKRVSLGWTDLDKAFASAMASADAKTHVVYVGDGIPVTTNTDPVEFTKRLKSMYPAHAGTFHAVATGSSYEPGVMKSIASLGGGSWRRIGGEQGPTAVALELLREVAQPTLRDVKVEFTGLRTARVYPTELPNVPAGMQQILLGRYLPEGRDQEGEVIVTGTLDGKPVRMATKVSLKDAEAGNSFIPRLWARMHLDVLLELGASESIKDEIIALSEEFNIMTPYTSFLVLESDADRERFGVKKHFRMRDGEKFFAEGRDQVDFALMQQQMKRAALYRANLRRDALRSLSGLGRNAQLFQRQVERLQGLRKMAKTTELSVYSLMDGTSNTVMTEGLSQLLGDGDMDMMAGSGGWGGRSGATRERLLEERGGYADVDFDGAVDALGLEKDSKKLADKSLPELAAADEPAGGESRDGRMVDREEFGREVDRLDEASQRALELSPDFRYAMPAGKPFGGPMNGPAAFEPTGSLMAGGRSLRPMGESRANGYFRIQDHRGYNNDSIYWQQQWWGTLFPPLPPAAKPGTPAKSKWPDDARKLAQSLLRRDQLQKLTGGLELKHVNQSFDPRYKEMTSQSSVDELYSPKSWLTRNDADGQQTVINWCDGKERGLIHRAFGIGRLRPADANDLNHWLSLNDFSLSGLEETYGPYAASVEDAGKDRARLVLKMDRTEIRVLIDTQRHVILSLEYLSFGKVQSTTKFSDFIEVAGSWWATKVESTNDKGQRTGLTTLSIKALSADELAAGMKKELAGRDSILFFKAPLPKLSAARKAIADNKATLEDQVVMLQYFAAIQQWTKVREHLEAIEKLTDKAAKRWLRDAVLHLSRRFDELKQRHMDEALKLALPEPFGDSGKAPGPTLPPGDAFAIAQHLWNRSTQFMQAAELLPLLERLGPIYRVQPLRVGAMKQFARNRYYQLSNLGRPDEANAILKQLATEYPRDYSLQQEYAQALANTGDMPAGLAWIDKSLAANPQWYEWEEEGLRNQYVQLLTQQGAIEDVLKYAEAWMKNNPASRTSYAIYLGTLYRLDQEEKANATLANWLKEGMVHGEMKPEVTGRLGAAISQAMGQGYNMANYQIQPRWIADLVAVAKFFAHDERNGSFADQIMGQLQYSQADEAIQLRRDLAADLLKAVPTLTPDRLNRLLGWLINAHSDAAYWPKLAAALRERWQKEKESHVRAAIAQSLITVLRQRGSADELLAFLRLQLKEGDADQRAGFARQLFDTLLQQSWKIEYENEAFGLLSAIAEGMEGAEALRVRVEALYRLTDRMVAIRAEALNAKIDRPDKLTRTELRDKQTANLKTARTEFADRLAKQTVPNDIADWAKMERMYLDTILERNQKQVETDCWELLGSEPPKPADPEAEIKPQELLDALLKERAFATLNYLATRTKAEPASIEKILKYLDKGIAQEGEGTAWKSAKHRLLIALDRPKDLERDLNQWIAAAKLPNFWRLNLGYLLAELGRLKEAVALFEKIHADHELGPLAYRSLADWYMVLNQKEKHEQALVDQYQFTDEHTLSRMVQIKLYPWQRGDNNLPSELDKDVLRIFAVLFEKSASPANYVYQLQAFYQACRDFRLLGVLADAVVGQTPVKIYPFLQALGGVFGTIQDEAVVDQMMEHLAKVREKAKTAVDKRALDLMEVLVQRRAAELKNQPGEHGQKALAAMQRAFGRDWADGEQALMANLLRSLNNIAYKPMADEQVRELQWLHQQQKKNSYERLQVGNHYAIILNLYGRNAEATDALSAELADYMSARNGILPANANEMAGSLLSFYRQVLHHALGEQFVKERLQKPGNEEQRFWLTQQLDTLYHDALARDAEVSLGRGAAIYPALEKKLRADSAQGNPYHQWQIVQIACMVYATAKDKHIAAYRDDLLTYANKLLPEVLKFQHNYYDPIIQQVAGSVRQLLGPVEAIEFVLNRIEKEPAWMRLNNQDGWSRHGGSLAVWRSEARNIGNLEPRLLKLVLSELRRDLDTQRQTNRSIYIKHSGYYWIEKETDFRKVAEEVYAKRQNSGHATVYIAEYLYHGLGHTDRAVEMLYAAHAKKLLDDNGLNILVDHLRQLNRHREAVALLEPLVKQHPDNLTYRVWLMNSYFHTRQRAQLMALLKDSHDYFHKENRWNEGVSATLGASTLENELWAESVEYYEEAIPLHQRSAPNRGIGDGTLAQYYTNQALAYSRLGLTLEAVDAASGAIVAWPAHHQSRQHYLDRLRDVLAEAKDLDRFVAKLDAREKESGLGSPVIRKAVAKAYQARHQLDRAIVQFRVAIELQPEDFESYDQLIACYDQVTDREGAIAATLEAVQLARRNLALYRRLGDRYASVGRNADAERAYTSLVEMQPNEAESHTMLAEVRQQQNRWDEAIAHWEQAAKARALEPTALIELAKAQLHQKQWDKADATITKLERTSWPARFDNQREAIKGLRRQWQQK